MARKELARAQESRATATEYAWWGIVLLIVLLTAAVRARLLDIPLERDEGEYGYAGQLMLQGIPPYRMAYNMKPPGTYAAYALLMAVFGQSPRGIHLGLLVVNAGTIVLMFLLGRRLIDPLTGVLSAAGYALLSMSQSVLGPFAHATHFLVLPAIGGILILLRSIATGRARGLFWSGLLLGVSCLMKQHAVFLAAFCAIILVLSQFRGGREGPRPLAAWLWLGAGFVAPLALTGIVLYAAGTFARFWFWTFTYAREYASELTIAQGLSIFPDSFTGAVGPSILLWILAGAGLFALFRDDSLRSQRAFLLLFTLFSFLAVCPGFYFRAHYFIVLLPAVALLAALAARSAGNWLAGRGSTRTAGAVAALILAPACAYQIYEQRDFLFRLDMTQASRVTYGPNPFPESLVISDYIRSHTSPADRIAILGSEPQIYFYSGRHSATGYIYTYGLMEPQPFAAQMQDEMIHEIEEAKPAYIVLVNVSTSWLWRQTSEKHIFNWGNEYTSAHYDVVGIVDLLGPETTEYRWDASVTGYKPRSLQFVAVYKRKAGA